jgi:hypothetical protein
VTEIDRQLMEVDLAEHLVGREGAGLLPRSEQAQLKTYLIEAHEARSLPSATDLLERVASLAQAEVAPTADPSLFLLTARVEVERASEEAGFWLDTANPRFWLLHSKSNAKPAQAVLRRLILGTKSLDYAWLPRTQLRLLQSTFQPFGFRLRFDERPFYAHHESDLVELAEPTHRLNVEHAGVGSEEMYDLLYDSKITRRAMAVSEVAFWDRSQEGTQILRLSREGRLRSIGSSLTSHLKAARTLIRGYEAFVFSLESLFGLRVVEDPLGVALEGQPLGVEAIKPSAFEFQLLVERLFSGVEPFRLLGSVDWRADDLAWVEAVDLHTGAPLRLDLTPTWMRLYLSHGLCGNTLARFVTNLQRSYNADVQFFNDEARAAFEPVAASGHAS